MRNAELRFATINSQLSVLFVAGDDEVDDCDEEVACLRFGELRYNFNGFVAKALHCIVGIFDTAMTFGIFDEGVNLVGVENLFFRECEHFIVLRQCVVEQHMEQGECDFPFAKVVAGGFAYLFVVEIVEKCHL